MERTSHSVSIVFNDLVINEVIIDQHYKINHPEVNDQIILDLVKTLNGYRRRPSKIETQYSYFVEEPIWLAEKPYRLIMLLEKDKRYLGVINAFRVREKKYGISI